MSENGLLRLSQCVEDFDIPLHAPLVVNVSSISLPHSNAKWLRGEFCYSLAPDMHANDIHVVWPTAEVVRESKHGGGGLCFGEKKACNDTYLREKNFYQYDAAGYGRQNYVAHMKSIVRVLPNEEDDDRLVKSCFRDKTSFFLLFLFL
jgi:hypothetical protein